MNAAAIDAALLALGVLPLADRRPSQLSGGQAQRVALARAVLALGHGLKALVGSLLAARGSLPLQAAIWLPQELRIRVAAIAVPLLAAAVPALGAYRVDVARLLNTR